MVTIEDNDKTAFDRVLDSGVIAATGVVMLALAAAGSVWGW